MKIISYFKLPEYIEELLNSMGDYKCLYGYDINVEDIKDAEIIIGNLPPMYVKECKKLKYLQLIFAGSDGYRDVINDSYSICNASGTFGAGIAEHLIMNTLMLFRNMKFYMEKQQKHIYERINKNKMIYGSRFLICGCGDIGTQFAKRIQSLGGYTIGIKRRKSSTLAYFDEVYTEDEIEKHLKETDVVALCLPKNDSTNHFLNAKRISMLRKDAIVLNVGRGNAIDTRALINSLNEEKIAGAALDVFDEEPIPLNDDLWDCKNLIITPHVSGTFANAYTYELFCKILEDNLIRYREGKPLKNVVDKESGYRKEVY